MADDKKNSKNLLANSKIATVLKRYNPIIVVGEVIVILFIGYFAVISPQLSALRDERAQTDRVKDEVDKQLKLYSETEQKLLTLLDAYQDVSSVDVDAINAMIPSDKELKEIFLQISTIVKRNGLLLNSVEVTEGEQSSASEDAIRSRRKKASAEEEEEKDVGRIGELSFNVSVSGVTYGGLKNTLSSFENNLRLIDVVDIGYNPNSNSAELALKSYFFKSPKVDVN